jgi:hypothetical protein
VRRFEANVCRRVDAAACWMEAGTSAGMGHRPCGHLHLAVSRAFCESRCLLPALLALTADYCPATSAASNTAEEDPQRQPRLGKVNPTTESVQGKSTLEMTATPRRAARLRVPGRAGQAGAGAFAENKPKH